MKEHLELPGYRARRVNLASRVSLVVPSPVLQVAMDSLEKMDFLVRREIRAFGVFPDLRETP